jgi:hypothetical protein
LRVLNVVLLGMNKGGIFNALHAARLLA